MNTIILSSNNMNDKNGGKTPVLPKSEMTKDQWEEMLSLIESGKSVEVAEDVYYHFLECVPPTIIQGTYFECGEPLRHDDQGKAVTYAFWIDVKGSYWGALNTVVHDERKRKSCGIVHEDISERQLTAIDGETTKMTTEHKELLKAHNNSPDGLNLIKVSKERNKGFSDTPLFALNNQSKLF